MKRLLIANRGEIALRILRASKDLGIETVAAYSQTDRDALHLSLADETVCIGKHSYLDAHQMLAAAISRGCDAVHPGYGFLAEDPDFAASVEAQGLVFVGPTPQQISLMGDKAQARQHMQSCGIPVLPGSVGEVRDLDALRAQVRNIGLPVMLKASRGGGGLGILLVEQESALAAAWQSVSQQALTLFSGEGIYLEKFLASARHIEIQIAGDGHGRVVYLGSRECSIQRRHQKILEEAPPPGIDPQVLDSLAMEACRALGEINYRNLGTLEFLFQDGQFYFIEMNTRIQVEHPVTECVTGLDLVNLQLLIAGHGPCELNQHMLTVSGHAIECRINAEDEDYHGAPGIVDVFRAPGGPGIRLDSQVYEGYRVPHQYDSLVAKLIAHGADRDQAVRRMRRALSEFNMGSLQTNIALHEKILHNEAFISGEYDTTFLDRDDATSKL